MGVPLFFVISGFVVLMSGWGRTVPEFVSSRVGRLFPAYWVAVAVSGIITLWVWPAAGSFFGAPPTKVDAVLDLTMANAAFGHFPIEPAFWTLWTELRFYVIIAVFIAVGINRRRVLLFATIWPVLAAICASGSDVVTVPSVQAGISQLLIPDYAPYFAGGMLLYLIHREGGDFLTWTLVAVQVIFGLRFALGYYPSVLAAETPWAPSSVVIALVSIGCFGLVAVTTITPVARLSAHWMTWLGALTYPVYLFHENLGWFVIHLLGSDRPWLTITSATAVVTLVAYAAHRLVERPLGLRLRMAVLNGLRRAPVSAESATPPRGSAQDVPAAGEGMSHEVVRPVERIVGHGLQRHSHAGVSTRPPSPRSAKREASETVV